MDPARRLAQAVATSTKSEQTPYRTATVTAVYPEYGLLDMDITIAEGDTVNVAGVRYGGGSAPQVGRQVTYVLNGTEPYVISESGDVHDPVFQGRVVANSFHALPGENLLARVAASVAPWAGWSAGATAVDVLSTGELQVAVPGATAVTLVSPEVDLTRTGRHYTGWVSMPDDGINARAWVEVIARTADGTEESWGSYVDAVRVPGTELARYPMPDANVELDATFTTIQLAVHVGAGAAGDLTITSAYLGTAPVMEGGAVLLGRTQIDQAGFRLDGEDLLSPWTVTVYAGSNPELGGADWTVRHRRIGKTAFVECLGVAAGATTWSLPTSLPLPYAAASTAILNGYILDLGTRYYPVVANVEAGTDVVRRVIHPESGNGGTVDDVTPFTWAAGDQLRLTGSYEAD